MNKSPALLAHITPFQCLGGIVFPEIAKKKPQKGTVLTVGPGRIDDNGKRIEMEVKADDLVLYTRFNSTKSKSTTGNCSSRGSEILAVVEK